MRSARFGLLLSILSQSAALPIYAQITNVNDNTMTPIPGAGHNYIQMLGETVNPSNGSVSLRIQTPTAAGRQLAVPFSFAYDSAGISTPETNGLGGGKLVSQNNYLSVGGWSYSLPLASSITVVRIGPGPQYLECDIQTGFVLQDSAGTRHSLPVAFGLPPQNCGGVGPLSGGEDVYQANVSTYSVVAADPDGTTYKFGAAASGCGTSSGPEIFANLPKLIEDRNGNIVTFSDPNCSGAITETDTLGRVVLSSSGFGATGNTVSISGLSQPYTLTWATQTPSFNLSATLDNPSNQYCRGGSWGNGGPYPAITAITLPTGDKFQFFYDSTYALVNKIVYPGGGYVSYTWAPNTQAEFATLPDSLGNANVCFFTYDLVALSHRYVSFDGVTVAQQQDFSYSTNWGGGYEAWSSKQTTVTTHDLLRGTTSQTVYTYGPLSVVRPPYVPQLYAQQIPLEQTVVDKDGNGVTQRTVSKTWADQFELTSQQTTVDGLTSQINYTYGSGAQVTEKDEYDFGTSGPGPLLRKTTSTYQSFSNTPIYTYGPSIFDRPCQTIVYDGSSNRVAETDSLYDGGATVCGTAGMRSVMGVSNLPAGTHDETYYGASSTAPRGNLTSKTVQCFPSCSNAVSTYAYDETGQVLTSTDPCGNAACADMTGTNHTTTYSYADCFTAGGPSSNTNAYLTTITRPSTNGVAHVQGLCYTYADGQRTKITDENQQVTTLKYNDPMDRLTEIDYPDKGQTTISYPNPTTTEEVRAITSTISTNVFTYFDGVGQTIQTKTAVPVSTCSGGWAYTDTAYDGLGRTFSVSNPYCTKADATYGVTQTYYDVLNRPCLVVPPDGMPPSTYSCPTTSPGNDILTTYSANSTTDCATVTDQAGNSRKSCTDGLGRMKGVWEDPGSSPHLNYETDYQYNLLDDLISVVQNGSRQRTFTYDSLSRLTQATNPESGIISYSYDANGNLISKTAPAPNQTGSATVATTQTYDALNRITSKTYSNGTPGVYYYYDQSTWGGLTLTNPIGRFTSAGTFDGTCWLASSGFSYDPMSRLNLQIDYLLPTETSGCPGGIWTTTSASYDLAGNQTSLTYPSGRKVTDQYDGAMHLTQVTFASMNGQSIGSNYLTSATYAPTGASTSLTLGSGAVESECYNKRLQPGNIQVVSGSSTWMNLTYNYYTSGSGGCSSSSTSGDNGNVMTITDNANGNRTQTFTYDSLNRLSTAQSAATSGADCWGQSFGYDAWANLLAENVTKCSGTQLSVGVNTQNQITNTGFQYDAAGNLLKDGFSTYVYDSENRVNSLNSSAATYVYDFQGRRRGKTIGTVTTEYIDFNGQVISEYNVADRLWIDYVFAGDRRLASAGMDQIYNGGFEDGLQGWTTGTTTQLITDPTRAHSGNNYVQVSGTTANVNYYGVLSELIAVNPGDKVTFGGWAYLEPGSPTSGYVSWVLGVLDANGNAIGNMIAGNTTASSWTLQSATYTVPAGGASVGIWCEVAPTVSGTTTARFDDAFLTGASGLGVHYYHGDHLGSARLITDNSGNQTWSATYLPFGQEWNPQPTTNHYKFTGKERDSESGLDNFGARYDSSQYGRFMTPDPGNASGLSHMDDPQSWNGYAYARNNPLSYTDPSGLNYTVCQYDSDGNKTNCADLTNEQYKQYQQQNSNVHSTASGDLYLTNENGSETKIGNASYYNEKDVAAAQQITQYGPPLEFLGELEGVAIMGPGMGMLEGTLPEAGLAGGLGLGAAARGEAQVTPAAESTGRTVPVNLKEQLAMQQAKSNPAAGQQVPLKMNDPRWPDSQGWVKMRQNVNGVEVHYNLNTKTGEVADFKFK